MYFLNSQTPRTMDPPRTLVREHRRIPTDMKLKHVDVPPKKDKVNKFSDKKRVTKFTLQACINIHSKSEIRLLYAKKRYKNIVKKI